MLYRVRSSWDLPESQLGAYEILQNAVEKANEYYGFKVFDESGKCVHTSTNPVKVPYRVRVKWSDETTQVGAYEVYDNAVRKANEVGAISVFDDAGRKLYTSPAAVKTMSYKAKLKKKVGSHKKGETVVVTRDMKKRWVMADGTIVPNKSDMDLTKQIYDHSCKYSKETAEAFVNQHGFDSATGFLFWCNKYGQWAYVFEGSKGNWKLAKVMACGTGNISYGDGSDQGVGFKWKIWDKTKAFKGPRGTQYYNQHYSSKWGNSIHQGGSGKPSTHGCISLGKSNAIWVFNTVPINTRVVVY